MGSIFRQKGRTTWMMKYWKNGKPIFESSGSEDKTEARKLVRARETDIDKGLPLSAKVGKLRFEEASADVLNDYVTNGKRSLDDVRRRIELHLAPVFAGRRMAAIMTADIRAYVRARLSRRCSACDWMAQDAVDAISPSCPSCSAPTLPGASAATINRELAALKRMFVLAIQGGKLLHRPHIPMLKENNVRTGFFERDQFEAVREQLPEYLRPIITFAYLTGWRVRSEVLPLEWRQVDLKAGTIRLDAGRTKNDAGRVFPFSVLPELQDVIDAQLKVRQLQCPYVFHRNGEPWQRVPRKAWDEACAAAGWPTLIPHDFRRTAVRNLVRAGVPEKTAMMLTGHKTRSVFDRYDIVNEADLRQAVSRLANAATSSAPPTRGRVLRVSSRARR